MKKVANFIINKKTIILAIMLIVTVVCGFLATKVKTNADMTKYLSESSNMNQGLTIMDTDFPESEEKASVRVMFDDLEKEEIRDVKAKLKAIPYVNSVKYEAGSKDYNIDNHTLFVLGTEYDYGTSEEKSIEQALNNDFSSYNMVFCNNDIQSTDVSFGLLASAMAMLLVILFIMSESWLEPILFLAAIGVAVVINLGTNIIFPYTAGITASIAPILQLALSMDYSIMLMSRYRQEKLTHDNKTDAMKAALANSFSSVASSALTTVVGLLALVFLTFKLGPELGIILAKGVFISMICVFTVLPALILMFDKGIEKSKKKYPRIPMGGLAKFSKKARFVIPAIFAVLLVSFSVMQSDTGITFTEGVTDPVAKVFAKENTIVMVYNNKDEDDINNIISLAEDDEHIKSVTGYTNTLGEERTAADMSDAISDISDNLNVDEKLMQMIYYNKYNGKTPDISAENFLNFINNEVLSNDTFSEFIGNDLNDSKDYINKFSSKKTLVKKMSADDMAEFLDMDSDNMKKLYLYYYTENGGVPTGTLTVHDFVDFVINTVAKDEDYSSMFDSAALSQLKTLQTYTDKEEMTKYRSYKDAAKVLDMDNESMKMLYVYYQAKKYSPGKITLAEFVAFMQEDVAKNPMFSAYIDSSVKKQMAQLAAFTDKKALNSPLSMSALSKKLGMDEQMTKMIYVYKKIQDKSYKPGNMTLTQLLSFIQTDVAKNPMFASYFNDEALQQLKQLEKFSGKEKLTAQLSIKNLAQSLGIAEPTAKIIWTYYKMQDKSYTPNGMTLSRFVSFMQSDIADNPVFAGYIDSSTKQQINMLASFSNKKALSAQLTPKKLSSLLGMSETNVENILNLSGNTSGTMSVKEIVSFILSNSAVKSTLNAQTVAQLETLQAVTNLVMDDTVLSYDDMAAILGTGDDKLKPIFIFADSAKGTMSLYVAISFILSSNEIKATLTKEQLSQLETLKTITGLVLNDTALSYGDAASIFGIDKDSMKAIFALKDSADGKMSVSETVAFILNSDEMISQLSESELAQIKRLQTIIGLVQNNKSISYKDIASFAEMDVQNAKLLFTYHDAQKGGFEKNHYLSVQKIVNYLIGNSKVFSSSIGDNMSNLKTAQSVISSSVSGKRLAPSEMGKLLGMKSSEAEDLYLLNISKFGDTSSWKLSPQEFVAFTMDVVLPNEDFANYFDSDAKKDLKAGRTLIDAVISGKAYSVPEMYSMMATLTDEITKNDVEMLYLYYAGIHDANGAWTMTIPQLLNYLCDEFVVDARFSDVLDDKTKADIMSSRSDLADALEQMKGKSYSRLVFTTDLPDESAETTDFVAKLDALRHEHLQNDSYIVGTSAMVYEMENSFHNEYLLITLITAAAVFLVVLLAFKRFIIPAILTLLVQCGVFITVTVIGWQGLTIYYLALLVVQSILMGATIDYAIVFSNYYRENRTSLDRTGALKAAYEGTIHTIMTSGLILIVVTFILGMFSPAQITSQVCMTISMGSLIAVLLILFILPGMLAFTDRFIVQNKKAKRLNRRKDD